MLIQKELSNCLRQLARREEELQERMASLQREAIARRNAKDLAGAKKRMIERRRVQAQLEKLQNSMTTIEIHRNTIEGSVLDRTVLETLRASGDFLWQMGANTGGLRAVEEIVADVEAQVENATEITKIISAGNVSGIVNTMAIDGIIMDEDELMRELDDLASAEEDSISKTISNTMVLPSVPMPIPAPPATTARKQQQVQQQVLHPISV